MATSKIHRLDIETEKQADRVVVHCSGKVDLDTWTEFSATVRLLIPESKLIRVDMANVTRVDSTGLGALVSVWTAARGKSCDLKYINPTKRIKDVIRITSLLGIVEGNEAEERELTRALTTSNTLR